MEKFDRDERLLGGIFGIIAIIAAFSELLLSGLDAVSFAGAVKDIAGTLVAIIVFFTIMKNLTKENDFRGSIEGKMNEVIKKYEPLVMEEKSNTDDNINRQNKLMRTICYGIASSSNVLFGGTAGYVRFLEIESDNPDRMEFLIRKKFFGDSESTPYNPREISERIVNNLRNSFPNYTISYRREDDDRYRVIVSFNGNSMTNKEGIETIIDIIEKVILLYVILGRK
ncbi:hypothetical protein E8P77_12140 [Soehngenia saccharolytica]|jgi:hypothetical protein|nr:hypothetical protein [Tissierellales bacterium]TJX64514.1 hypothetical protein E8P77_12140 [Soehngenia saccharolytica]